MTIVEKLKRQSRAVRLLCMSGQPLCGNDDCRLPVERRGRASATEQGGRWFCNASCANRTEMG